METWCGVAGQGLQAELCYALLGYTGSVIRREACDGSCSARFRVAPTVDFLAAWEREAVEACVAPGAWYAACREHAEALLEDPGSCARRAVAREASAILDEYAGVVVAAEEKLACECGVIEGPARLRFETEAWGAPLAAVCECLWSLRRVEPRGGAVVDALRKRARAAGAPKVASVLRRLAASAAQVFLRQLCAWCTSGETVDPHGEFFIEGKQAETLASEEARARAKFVGEALRVLRAADDRGRGASKKKYAPADAEVEAWVRRWAALVEACGQRSSDAAQAVAIEARVARDLDGLVADTEAVVARKLLEAVEDAGLYAALCSLAGVALLRCGPLWQRALELARPGLNSAPDDDDAPLLVQRALEDASRELWDDEPRENEAYHFWTALLADATPPRGMKISDAPKRRRGLDDGDAFAATIAAVADGSVGVVADPQGFEWRAPRTDHKARYELGGGETSWTRDARLRLGPGASLSTVAARRLEARAWRCELAFRWDAEGATPRRAAISFDSVRVSAGDDARPGLGDAGCRLVVEARGREIAARDAGRMNSVAGLRLVVEQKRDAFDPREWRLETNLYDDDNNDDDKALAVVSFLADLATLVGRDRAVVAARVPSGCRPLAISRFAFCHTDGEPAAIHPPTRSLAGRAALADRRAERAASAWRDALRVVAAPRWPLDDLLLDSKALAAYNAAFRRLVVARRATADLDAVWKVLAASSRAPSRHADEARARRHLWALHARASHLSRSIATWLQRDAVEPSWRDLRDRLRCPADFARVERTHADFLVQLAQALLVDDKNADEALNHVFANAARLSAFLQAHAAAPEDAPASALAKLGADFRAAAAALFALPQLRTPLEATADFSGWFADLRRRRTPLVSTTTTTTTGEEITRWGASDSPLLRGWS
ncbi:hypothetical protein CTAYLR_010619 [Chrysophaeum taylorii]|uniref:Spindle pole body component n=1 Tax=Chrysophaeum taylorii TaxID=2483200 RepID=A0AAD7XLU8_9STRA|nr:hypothetical protein CTAYLR_010619 [Chrysophaeum taylorii]